jgi:hypothetical protein
MSHYQLFQNWWKKATSTPAEFNIDKRSAEIGFEAAINIKMPCESDFVLWCSMRGYNPEHSKDIFKYIAQHSNI